MIHDGSVNIKSLGLALINGNTSKICLPEEGDIGLHLILGQKTPTTYTLYLTLGSKVGQMLIYDGPVDIYTLGLALINGNTSKICLPEEGDIGLHLILGRKVPTILLYT